MKKGFTQLEKKRYKRLKLCFSTRRSLTGFTIIELMVFVAVFSVAAVFLVGVLSTVTRTQLRQASSNEVGDQAAFVVNTIQRLVHESSLIANEPSGVASTTLILRRTSSTVDTTKIFVDSGMTGIYLQEIDQYGIASTTIRLTSDKVKIANFLVTKYQTPGGTAAALIDLTIEASTSNSGAKLARSWRGAVTRVSAATFDSALTPASDGTLNLGSVSAKWNYGYFANDLTISNGRLIIGSYISPPPAGMKIFSTGDLGFSTSTAGVVLKSPNGSCFRVGISNAGALTTTTLASCPQ